MAHRDEDRLSRRERNARGKVGRGPGPKHAGKSIRIITQFPL